MTTPHISAKAGDFAELCLFPGDPLRAKHIAETHLDSAELISDTRNMLAFTGQFRGTPVSVMGSGMGMPSCALYAQELFQHFGVERLVRVGSCGAVSANLNLRDLVVAQGACTDSSMNQKLFGGYDFAAIADYKLLSEFVGYCQKKNQRVAVGNVFSTDSFYHPDKKLESRLEAMNVLALDMEAAALYAVAAIHKKQALAVMTVSDEIRTGNGLSANERQTAFNEMTEMTLESLLVY
ncbi:purine-nucleoside phosphorylase [Idiomarina sp. M1R2S28]|uniref:Purine nucleoside phosphorylase DeoD-type n=1 Tax=Idiomarina rhizosphaerae TaxID=2961572 RepID=A0A9X2FUG3_9GAMM|nr:purine-nucleoside phosphorylase [Idiomarina rhizosphaerae]MCP1338165.1 purine-nucleoside phosphorylase [Idiomarina rhizosphaerae]